MSLKPVGSIFDMSIAQIDFYSTRLYPHNHTKGYWGFSSVTGFLNPNEDLLQCGYNDCYLIESHGVSHNDIIRKLIKICSTVMFGESSSIIEGKFRVWRSNSTKEFRQLCPFTLLTNKHLNPFEIPKTCGQNNFDFIINNMDTKRYLVINSLALHLICDPRVKVIFPEYLLHLTEKIEKLEMAIKSCEAIKAKQINERSSFTAFPTDIQIKIITSVPFSDWPCLHNFMAGLKNLYNLDEPLFYRSILPLLINEGLLKVNRMDSYPLEFREIAPYLKSIDVSASLLYQSKINAKQLTSVQSLKIDYSDYINFRTSNLYPGEFNEEIFDHLGSLTQIKKIEFTGRAGYFDVLSLKKLTNLHTLSLNVLDNSNFTDFSYLTNLQTLKLGFTADNEELKSLGYGISRMTHLKNLYLDLSTENFITLKEIKWLTIPHLTNLKIQYGSYNHYSKDSDIDPEDLNNFLKKEGINTNIFLKKSYSKVSNSSIEDFDKLKGNLNKKFYS